MRKHKPSRTLNRLKLNRQVYFMQKTKEETYPQAARNTTSSEKSTNGRQSS